MSEITWLNEKSRTFLSRGYLREGQTAEQKIELIANAADKILKVDGWRDKFYQYLCNGWYSLSSPVWANFGEERGLPISCNGQYIADNLEDIIWNQAETGIMTKHGAGTSAYFGDIRGRGKPISTGGNTFGAVHFMQMQNSTVQVVSQSNVRRGNFAAYYPVEGDDIAEFLELREDGNEIQHISLGVTVTDQWMKEMVAGDKAKIKIWKRIIKKRFESGYPYIFWTDTVNNNAPLVYKDKGMKIHASNLCTEICLSSSTKDSFVCNLSSMNLEKYDEWKDTDAIEVLTYFLDAVMTEYITKTEGMRFMEKANHFAKTQRALGIGGLGWHSLLQSKMLPFACLESQILNNQIWKLIQEKTLKASIEMAILFGEPELLKGYGRRNVCLTAIAPTTSSSFILGQVSPSIEPIKSNYFDKDLAKGKFGFINQRLKKLLKEYNKDDKETWESIRDHGGSVQHLNFLTDHEKDVFKTFLEISQKEIIAQAAVRQKYLDQSQSLNLMTHPETKVKDVNALMMFAWESGIKTLYYQRGQNASQELARAILNDVNECVACEA